MSAPMASAPQTTRNIGRFEVVQPLGRGMQGSVWLAHDPQLKREVAIKTIDVDASTNPAAVRTLLEEAVMASRLVHPGLVTLFDAGRDGDKPYLVFEYVPGRTLATVIRDDGRIAPLAAARYTLQMLQAVEFAHRKGVVHRDLKPANVMIAADDIARIMDFGIASLVSGVDPADTGFHGTPAYTAPEYVTSREFSPRSDVFSIGLMLHEMLTGEPAISGSTVFEVLHKIANVPFTPPSGKAAEVDEVLDGIVMRALAKDPTLRYASAQEMADAIEDYLRPAKTATAIEHDGSDGTLEFLLRRIRLKNDFPALSNTITSVTKAISADKQGLATLASAILKDFAITNKLLKLVNSAHYGQLRGGVSTVTRAIMVLGFDQVRSMAVGLMLFDHLQNRSQAAGLRDEIIAGYFGALLARSLATPAGVRDSEEAFIAALFHNLGRLLTAFYFHEEHAEIMKSLQQGGDEREVAIALLGSPLDELGAGVARSWKFPEEIIASMQPVVGKTLEPPPTEAERMRMLASLVRGIVDAVRFTPDQLRGRKVLEIEQRFAPALGVNQSQILTAVAKAVRDVSADASVLGMKTGASPFFARAVAWTQHLSGDRVPDEAQNTIAGTVLDSSELLVESEATDGTAIAANRKAALTAGIQDITNVLVGKYQMNDVLRMVVETMYRGAGFSRVLLLIRDAASNSLKTRMGLGTDIESILRKGFSIPLAPAKDVFHAVLAQGIDLFIEDANSPKVRDHVPRWYRQSLNAHSFALFPVMVGKTSVALLYGDSPDPGQLAFTPEELSLLKTLRNQAVMAIRAPSS